MTATFERFESALRDLYAAYTFEFAAREAGVDIQLREQPRAQMEEANRKSEHNIGEVNWWFPDPAIMTTNFHTKSLFGFNRPRLSNPEVDQMLVANPRRFFEQ